MLDLGKILGAGIVAVAATSANAATVDISGTDSTGFLSLSNVKNSADGAAAEAWSFPYYLGDDGIYHSIAAIPLSESSVYAEESQYEVLGKDITSSDFATLSAGTITYDESLLTGAGVEYIDSSLVTLDIDGNGFSPYYSDYNTGGGFGDFGFSYDFSITSLSGTGLTFNDGVLSSIDLDAGYQVSVVLGPDGSAFSFGTPYSGDLSIAGGTYAFSMDVTQDNSSPLGSLTDTRMVFNRTGTIDAVSPVPEPAVYSFLLAGLALFQLLIRRRGSAA